MARRRPAWFGVWRGAALPRMLAMALAAFAAPAVASAQTLAVPESALPPGIDRALWCASAFYWLAGTAEDSGDRNEAELYDAWSKRLLDMASGALTETGTAPARIEELIAEYDQRALEQLGTDAAPYDVITCPELLEEEPAAPAAPASPQVPR